MRLFRLPAGEFRSGEFRRIAQTPFFSVKIKKNDEGKWRMGVVAGTAVHKSAVKRNFWKRQARETVREALTPRTASGGGRDLLLILFSKVNALTKKQFREKLGGAVSREMN